MRVDSSPILLAGQAQAKANQAFGDAIGGVIEKFYQKKKDKQERDEREQAYLKMGLSSEEAKAASRDKDLANQFVNKMNADQNYNLELNKFNLAKDLRDLQMDQIRQAMENEKTDRKEDEISKAKDLEFNEKLLSQITSPQAQRQADMVAPGLSAFANPDVRNRFMQAQLQQPQNQVPVSTLGSQDFGRFASREGLDPTRSVARMEALRKAEADLAESNKIDPKDEIELKNKIETTRQLFDKPLNDLSDNFDKNKQVQDYKNVVISYNTIRSAAENPSAAGDLSLIFQYMKVLDPGSTVREGEFANAQNAAGVPDRIRNLFNNWSKGQRLDEKQRQDFITQAKKIVDARGKSIDPLIRQTRQKFDRTINKQNRNLTPDQANLLFEEVIFPDIKLPQNAQPKEQPPQNQGSINLDSGGKFTPTR